MRRMMLFATVVALFAVPTAQAADRGLEKQYLNTYEHVDKANAGPYKDGLAGRNLVEYGVNESGRAPTSAELRDSIAVMGRMLHPPPAPEPAATVTDTTDTSQDTSSTYSGGYSIPTECVMGESGGDWTAVNSSSGAGGAYQIIGSTWALYGGTQYAPSADQATPEQQSEIAAQIWADSGAEAWDAC